MRDVIEHGARDNQNGFWNAKAQRKRKTQSCCASLCASSFLFAPLRYKSGI